MVNKRNNTSMNTEEIRALDLHTAITGLVLHFKGTKTIDALSKKLDMPRKRLAKLFEIYQARMKGEEVPRSKEDPTPIHLDWELKHLIKIADKLDIRLSDLIRAAEDVQDGLPPWFRIRISRNDSPRTKEELINIFLEAAGCYTYAMKDPLGVTGIRRSFKHSKNNPFPEDAVSILKLIVNTVFGNSTMKELISAYEKEVITCVEAYWVLKSVVDTVIGDTGNIEDEAAALSLVNRVVKKRGELIDKISSDMHRLLEKKSSESKLDKKRAKKSELDT